MDFLKYIRACPLCQISFKTVEWLCEDCENKIVGQIRHHRHWIDDSIEHHYLFDWGPENQQISRLVHSLKGWGFFKPYKILSKIIFKFMIDSGLKTFQNSGKPEKPCLTGRKTLKNLFYPSQGQKDHALMLAHNLGVQTGLTPYPLIKQKTSLKQALLKRKDRQSIEIKSTLWKGKKALLVDDVVTTGATAKACWKALNRPEKLVVWSLFYRKNTFLSDFSVNQSIL